MAIGVPIAELESKFSSPDPDGDVAPQPEHRETYADLERRFTINIRQPLSSFDLCEAL